MESSLAVPSLLPALQPSLWPWDLSCQAVSSPQSGRRVVSARGPLRAVRVCPPGCFKVDLLRGSSDSRPME